MEQIEKEAATNFMRNEWARQHGSEAGFEDALPELLVTHEQVTAEQQAMFPNSVPSTLRDAIEAAMKTKVHEKRGAAKLAQDMTTAKAKWLAAGGTEAGWIAERENVRTELLRRAALASNESDAEKRHAETLAQAARTF